MSKLASAIGAIAAGLFAGWTATAHLGQPQQVAIVGVITAIAGLLSPALKAQLDASGGQLFAVVGTLVAFAVNLGLVHFGVPAGVQAMLLTIVTAIAGLLVPGVHLQQATSYRPRGRAPTS